MTFIKSSLNRINPAVVGRLAGNAHYAFGTRAQSNKKPQAVYYIEDITVSGPTVEVEFMLNEAWLISTIDFQNLKIFISNSGLNDFCFDSSDFAGNHIQDCGSIEIEEYLSENLNTAVLAYLKARKVGQYHIH